MKFIRNINPKKIYFALILILVSVFILSVFFLPNYYAAHSPPPGSVYSGQASWFDPWDINVYVAAINWSQENGFYFQNGYTTDPHRPILIYPLYTLFGIIFPQINPYMIFSVLAFFFGVVLLAVMAKLSSLFLKDKADVIASLLLISLGGGLGWMLPSGFLSPDIFTTPFTFNSTFQKPHEALAVSFYFTALVLFYLGIKKRKIFLNLASLIFIILVIPFYPYHLVSFLLISSYFALIYALKKNQKYPISFFLIILFAVFPFGALYSIYLSSGSSFEAVLAPFLSTPNIIKVAGGYGILFPLIILQLFVKKKDDKQLFLLLWFFLSLLISYLPFPFSRYFLRGLFFPGILLSINSLSVISKRFGISKKILLIALLATVPLSSFYIAYRRIDFIKRGGSRWFFLLKEEKEALDFLDNNAKSGTGVLASYKLGNFIPAYTKSRVYFGHNFQTPGSYEKQNKLTEFYSNMLGAQEAEKFLINNNISYIVWGVEEKEITYKSSLQDGLNYDFLRSFYSNSKIDIYSYSR